MGKSGEGGELRRDSKAALDTNGPRWGDRPPPVFLGFLGWLTPPLEGAGFCRQRRRRAAGVRAGRLPAKFRPPSGWQTSAPQIGNGPPTNYPDSTKWLPFGRTRGLHHSPATSQGAFGGLGFGWDLSECQPRLLNSLSLQNSLSLVCSLAIPFFAQKGLPNCLNPTIQLDLSDTGEKGKLALPFLV